MQPLLRLAAVRVTDSVSETVSKRNADSSASRTAAGSVRTSANDVAPDAPDGIEDLPRAVRRFGTLGEPG